VGELPVSPSSGRLSSTGVQASEQAINQIPTLPMDQTGPFAMPLSTDINLPKNQTPVFPDRCVACGSGGPQDSIRIGTNAIGWWTLAFWASGKHFSVVAPACSGCRVEMQRQRRLRLVVSIVFGIIGVGVALMLLRGFGHPTRKWIALGIALACMLPYFIWEIISPRPVDLTAYHETVDYEFRDATYAAEFASLNKSQKESDSS
jgi:hypothetical protein